jgi:transcriptional regulator with XRE-family HTH domain
MIESGDYMKIYEKIKQLRTSKNLSQAELAEKLDLSHGHITRLETGKFNPSIEVLKKIADLFDVSADYLLNDSIDGIYDTEIQNEPLNNKIKLISTLEPKQQEAIITVIDSMLKEKKMKEVLNQNLVNV